MDKGKFYRRSLLTVLVISSLPTALLAVVFYLIGGDQVEREVNRTYQAQFQQVSERIDDYLDHVEQTITHWAYNPIFGEKLRGLHLSTDFTTTNEIYGSLFIMNESNPLIEEAYLLLREQNVVISHEKGVIPLNAEAGRKLESLVQSGKPLFWGYEAGDTRFIDKQTALSLFYLVPTEWEPAVGALMISIDTERLGRTISELLPNGRGASIILKESGEWVLRGSSVKGGNTEQNDLELALREEILKNPQRESSFILTSGKETYSVSYGVFTRVGSRWIYASAIPMSELTAPVSQMSRFMLIVGTVSMLVAATLAWLASRRLYRPIKRLVHTLSSGRQRTDSNDVRDEIQFIENEWQHLSRESMVMQTRLNQSLPALREGFLLQLVQGHLYSYSEADLRERMIQYGWDVQGKQFAVLIVQLVGFTSYDGRFLEGDEPLVTFAAGNIADELLQNRYEQAEVINFQDLTIGLWILIEEQLPRDQAKRGLMQLSQELVRTMNELLKINVAISIAKLTASAKDLPKLMEEARQAVRYRNLHEDNQILDMEHLVPQPQEGVYYPFDIEKELVQALRLGLHEETLHRVDEFMVELERHSDWEMHAHQGLRQLLGSIQHAILQGGFNPNVLYEGANLYEQMDQIRDPREAVRWLKARVIAPFMEELGRTQAQQYNQLVKKVQDTIARSYASFDLSLEYCADLHGTNSFTLSKAFKQSTGVNFIDYVTAFRLDKSKEMLLQTDLKISQVAERVGYQHYYFNRIFKKAENMTPTEYREKHKLT